MKGIDKTVLKTEFCHLDLLRFIGFCIDKKKIKRFSIWEIKTQKLETIENPFFEHLTDEFRCSKNDSQRREIFVLY